MGVRRAKHIECMESPPFEALSGREQDPGESEVSCPRERGPVAYRAEWSFSDPWMGNSPESFCACGAEELLGHAHTPVRNASDGSILRELEGVKGTFIRGHKLLRCIVPGSDPVLVKDVRGGEESRPRDGAWAGQPLLGCFRVVLGLQPAHSLGAVRMIGQ
jgi:hypothetical protein